MEPRFEYRAVVTQEIADRQRGRLYQYLLPFLIAMVVLAFAAGQALAALVFRFYVDIRMVYALLGVLFLGFALWTIRFKRQQKRHDFPVDERIQFFDDHITWLVAGEEQWSKKYYQVKKVIQREGYILLILWQGLIAIGLFLENGSFTVGEEQEFIVFIRDQK